MRYMLDTNMCVYIIKRRPAVVLERLGEALHLGVGLSSIALSEQEYGVARSSRPRENRAALTEFVLPLLIAPYDEGAACCYGELRARLEAAGQPLGSLDTLIGAHALSLGCALVTNNEREFARIPGLALENWTR